ncbi:MAG TPA: DoxX family protein [Bryobacteraceae bacterium]|nr:DoxX family protein [Bryobacteraceae bacterium]
MKAPYLAGRFLFGGFFVYSGLHHFLDRKSMADYTRSKGVPAPDAAVAVTGALLLAGGASILLGLKPKLGVAAITTALAGISPLMHDFWRVQDPQQRMNEMANFHKNLALAGAALALTGTGEPWPASLPALTESKTRRNLRRVRRLLAG